MRKVLFMIIVTMSTLTNAKEACAIFPVSHKTVAPGSSITWNGEKTTLLGPKGLRIAEALPALPLTNLRMTQEELRATPTVKLILFLPSVDTPVCDSEIKHVSATEKLNGAIDRVVVSMDLPYAQRRFGESNKIKNINFLSDYRNGAFGKAMGLTLERNGLFARAVVVVDKGGVIRYLQVVPEITEMPDLESAYGAANELENTKP